MTDLTAADTAAVASAIAVGLTCIATAFAAYAAWRGPLSAAELAERLRRVNDHHHQRQQHKLHVFATLMQERSEIYSEQAVRALNLIDVVYSGSRPVREAWTELYAAFDLKPIPPHVMDERLRRLLATMAADLGLGDDLRAADLGRVYTPTAIVQQRQVRDLQREAALNQLFGQGAPASNAAVPNPVFPPQPN